ncbi:MAG TPA: sugar phosphate nucleotidyltransferase [Verrucomicrobiae bacterium]|nr:sugar phosphate nucleotidyltransferase [Verrucomicrobiae bacterium]
MTGGSGPLHGLGIPNDAALTPFAGKYRFIDFALATATNSGVGPVYVLASRPTGALHTHLGRAAHAGAELRRPFPVPLPGGGRDCGRAARLVRALAGTADLVRHHRAQAIVVLAADHILQLDLRQLLEAHATLATDVTLATLPVPVAEASRRTVLVVGADRLVVDVPRPSADGSRLLPRGCALAWTGDLVVRAGALAPLLAAARGCARAEDHELLGALAQRLTVGAYDGLDNRVPGAPEGTYWHDPTTLETYYEAQMDLCTPRPALDLYNVAWPVRPVASGLGPAKVVGDAAGHAGQALNSLVSDGAIIRGGAVFNTVVGHGVLVESGAEVEDSVLLDGCRIGRGARVRRALVGAGAVVGVAGEIGYGPSPAAPARVVRSGLTLVPAVAESGLAAAAGT